MPDERPGGGYDWLYGSGSESRPTTVQPSQPRGDDLPPPNLPPPGSRGGSSGRGGSPRKSNGRRTVRIVLILILAWLLFLVGVPLWAWSTFTTVDADPGGNRPEGQPGATYLLVGSDSRKGLTKQEQKDLATGKDSGGRGRTDTILILHTGSGPSLLMSIPRDSLVPIEGYGTTKINAAYAFGGPELLVHTIEENTGLEIDDYVEVGFGGLVKVVDALDGVEICPKKKLKDKDAGLNIDKGCQNADGKTALAYSRSRHAHATGDIQRGQSQREVLGGIAAKAKSPWTFINPIRYLGVNTGAASSVQVGEGMGPIAMARFALALSSAMGGGGLNCTIPIADFSVRWDRQRALKMLGHIKNDTTAEIGSLCTKDGLPK
ncbi:LCP family protein [Aeromicrobium sp.]|uniref:LCP family protein n=1 Tax=Aeromicrobium sp. TaxID=1871063 RepID=UPI003C322898